MAEPMKPEQTRLDRTRGRNPRKGNELAYCKTRSSHPAPSTAARAYGGRGEAAPPSLRDVDSLDHKQPSCTRARRRTPHHRAPERWCARPGLHPAVLAPAPRASSVIPPRRLIAVLKVRTRPRCLLLLCGVWVRNAKTLFAVVGGRRRVRGRARRVRGGYGRGWGLQCCLMSMSESSASSSSQSKSGDRSVGARASEVVLAPDARVCAPRVPGVHAPLRWKRSMITSGGSRSEVSGVGGRATGLVRPAAAAARAGLVRVLTDSRAARLAVSHSRAGALCLVLSPPLRMRVVVALDAFDALAVVALRLRAVAPELADAAIRGECQ